MNVTTPDRVIEQQTADSNAPAENKFSGAAASGARHNDPRQQGGKQRQQGGQQKRDRRDVHGWGILD
ncbi:MAG TPA: tRNA pseudouridine(55) synthase TruB, partial [Afipia sp.]|nr:tRNA pseudouridine(55) synthase TruB [Afipia sp.]